MKINKSYVVASAIIASTSILPLGNVEQVDAASKTVTVESRVNFRKGPSKKYASMRKLHKGYKLTYLGKSGRWVKVKYKGKTGYVYDSYVSSVKGSGSNKNESNNNKSSLVSYAKTKLGKPYVWGAQGPNSFDCSGFTYYVVKNTLGKSIPRTSTEQSRYGTYVSKGNLRSGDLVFFDTVGSNNGNVSHAGIYIGNGRFIHASSTQKKVVISSLASGHYSKAFVNGRRL